MKLFSKFKLQLLNINNENELEVSISSKIKFVIEIEEKDATIESLKRKLFIDFTEIYWDTNILCSMYLRHPSK